MFIQLAKNRWNWKSSEKVVVYQPLVWASYAGRKFTFWYPHNWLPVTQRFLSSSFRMTRQLLGSELKRPVGNATGDENQQRHKKWPLFQTWQEAPPFLDEDLQQMWEIARYCKILQYCCHFGLFRPSFIIIPFSDWDFGRWPSEIIHQLSTPHLPASLWGFTPHSSPHNTKTLLTAHIWHQDRNQRYHLIVYVSSFEIFWAHWSTFFHLSLFSHDKKNGWPLALGSGWIRFLTFLMLLFRAPHSARYLRNVACHVYIFWPCKTAKTHSWRIISLQKTQSQDVNIDCQYLQ